MGKFIIIAAKSGFKFNLLAANGAVIAASQVYDGLESCRGGIESLRKNAPIAALQDCTAAARQERCPKFELYTDRAGEYRFRLRAANGKILAASEGYRAKKSCLAGIESVRRNAACPAAVEMRC
ncbi:MAG: YegP family protein [Firmicutes bacterium]|nr:YegP family protein [Bacillota bacterium]